MARSSFAISAAEEKFKQTLKADKKVVSDKKDAANKIQEKMAKLKAQRLAKKGSPSH